MTYRAFFLLAERFSDVVRSIRLRAPVAGSPVRSMRSTGAALGNLLLYSADLAQREYDIMRVRGYEGRLRIERTRSSRPLLDGALIALAALGLVTAIVWRIGWQALNPYSWLPLGMALVMLAAAGLYRWRQA
jgi:energy-coupling factor transporter transmembrane protein EcfT